MPFHELPHTRGCLVCGRDNPHGLHLHLHIEPQDGLVTCDFVPLPEHMGFDGIAHGGLISTVLDEAMVWAATWAAKRFCVCGELTVRFRQSVPIGRPVRIEARVLSRRSKLIETEASVRDDTGAVLAGAAGKYVPVSPQRNRDVIATLVPDPQTHQTLATLSAAAESL